MKRCVALVLIIGSVIANSRSLQAQDLTVEHWRSFAQTLPRNATVRVTLADGSRVEGRFQDVVADVMNLRVQTSPFGEELTAVPLDKIASVEKRSGSGKAIKIALIAAGVAIAAVVWLAFSIHD
jgi:hypothetical protein